MPSSSQHDTRYVTYTDEALRQMSVPGSGSSVYENLVHALRITHSEAILRLLLAARQGYTDAQICDALRQGLPHVVANSGSLQDSLPHHLAPSPCGSFFLRGTDAFAQALVAIPSNDWCRTWAAEKTNMLRLTSKSVKAVVDKLRLPAVVRLNRTFWHTDDLDKDNTPVAKLRRILHDLAVMPAR
jgi:hypothetical protein